MLCGQHHPENPAERLAAIMDGSAAKRIDDRKQVVDVGFDIQSGFEVVGHLRLTEPAQIRAHDLVEPAEIRDPTVPEAPRAAVPVLQEEIRRVTPRVGVVVERIVQVRFSGATDLGHTYSPCGSRA